MKAPHLVALDRDDRRALATLAGYLALLTCGVLTLLVLTLALALCLRLFLAVSGIGAP